MTYRRLFEAIVRRRRRRRPHHGRLFPASLSAEDMSRPKLAEDSRLFRFGTSVSTFLPAQKPEHTPTSPVILSSAIRTIWCDRWRLIRQVRPASVFI